MKKPILLVFFLFLVTLCQTQNESLDFRYAVKLYNLTSYEEQTKDLSFAELQSKSLQILHPTVAFQWSTKNRNFHEVELRNFSLKKRESAGPADTSANPQIPTTHDIVSSSFSAQYEYVLNFSKSVNSSIVPSLGFGINPYYLQSNIEPLISSQFQYSEIVFGAKLFVNPRVTFYFKSRFFIDLNLPICVSDIYYTVDKNQNPSLDLDQRSSASFDAILFPKYFSGRIGIGLKI